MRAGRTLPAGKVRQTRRDADRAQRHGPHGCAWAGANRLQISRRTQERIIALIEQDEAGAIEATAKQKAD